MGHLYDKFDIVGYGELCGPFLPPLYGIPEELIDGRVILDIYSDEAHLFDPPIVIRGPLDVLLYCIEVYPKCCVLSAFYCSFKYNGHKYVGEFRDWQASAMY